MSQASVGPTCPVCALRNITSRMKFFQISFDKAVLLCSKKDCIGDLSELELVDRKIDELRRPRSKWKKSNTSKNNSLRSQKISLDSFCNQVSENAVKTSNLHQVANQIHQEPNVPIHCTDSSFVGLDHKIPDKKHEDSSLSFLDDKEFWDSFDTIVRSNSPSKDLDLTYKELDCISSEHTALQDNSDKNVRTTDIQLQTSVSPVVENLVNTDADIASSAVISCSNARSELRHLDFSSLVLDFPSVSCTNSVSGDVTVHKENAVCLNQVFYGSQNIQNHPIASVTSSSIMPPISHSGSTCSTVRTLSTYSSILKKPTPSNIRIIKNVKFHSPNKHVKMPFTLSQTIQNEVSNKVDASQTLLEMNKGCRKIIRKKTRTRKAAVPPQSFILRRFLASDGEQNSLLNNSPVANLQEQNYGISYDSVLGLVQANVDKDRCDIVSLLGSQNNTIITSLGHCAVPLTQNHESIQCNSGNHAEAINRTQTGARQTVWKRKQRKNPSSSVKQQQKRTWMMPISQERTLVNTVSPLNSDQSNASDGDLSVVNRRLTVTNSNCPRRNVTCLTKPKKVIKSTLPLNPFPGKFLINRLQQDTEQERQNTELLSNLLQGSDLFGSKR